MKKVIATGALAVLGVVALSSCKKEYTCECSYDFAGTTMTTSTVIKDTKKNAEDACEGLEVSGYTCAIK